MSAAAVSLSVCLSASAVHPPVRPQLLLSPSRPRPAALFRAIKQRASRLNPILAYCGTRAQAIVAGDDGLTAVGLVQPLEAEHYNCRRQAKAV